MQKQLVRTTVQIDPKLLRQAKIKMAREDITFRDMIQAGLQAIVDGKLQLADAPKSKKKVSFGGYNLGIMKGSLRRKDIYEEHLAHIVR